MAALCVLVATSAWTAAAHAASSAQYRIEGRGWGHGIGMSQYGAAGYAEQGWTSTQIIEHYFTGTVVAPRPADGPTDLRVMLRTDLQPARLQMTSAGVVRQGISTLDLATGDIVEMRAAGAFLVVTRVRAGAKNEIVSAATAADATIVPQVDGGVRTLFRGEYARSGTSYRGTITGHRTGSAVGVINTVPFESYLRGVVPDESIPSWPAAALEAQAIAARSYALRGLRRGGWYDLHSTTVSQVYGGMDAEVDSTDAAILATANQVARVGGPSGEVAQTFFFSTSGGRTAGNEEVWGSTPYSYLRSVPSPYETASKYFVWKGSDVKYYRPSDLGSALGYSGTFRSAYNTRYPSGYADDVIVTTSKGQKSISASTIQSRLGLRSTFFSIGLLSIAGPDGVAAGATARLSGRIPRTGTTLLQLTRGGVTKSLRLKPTGAAGTWTVTMRMSGDPITARLMRAGVAGPTITVQPASLAAMGR